MLCLSCLKHNITFLNSITKVHSVLHSRYSSTWVHNVYECVQWQNKCTEDSVASLQKEHLKSVSEIFN